MSVVDIVAGIYSKALIEHPQYGRCVIAWNYFSLYYPGNPMYDTLTESYILFTENEGYAQKLYSGWEDCWISCNDGQTWQGGILSEGYYSDDMYIPFDSFSLTDVIDVGCGGADIYFNAFLRSDGTVYTWLSSVDKGTVRCQVEGLEDIIDVTMEGFGCGYALASDGTIYVFDPDVGVVTNTITDFTDDAWYNFSFTDENNKTVEGYISGLGSKMEEPSEDIYAIAYEEGDVVWKQYKLSGETWSETGIIYASNPFETVVTAGIMGFENKQDISIQSLPKIKDIKNNINAAIVKIEEKFYNSVGFDIRELTAKDKRMIVNGIACGVDDNMFWGLAQYITGAEQPDDDYFFMKSKCYTDAAFLSAYTVAAVGSAVEAVNVLTRAGLSAQMTIAASPTGAGAAVLGTATIAQLAESVVMTGVSFVAAQMAENSGNILHYDVGKLPSTKQYDIEVSLRDIDYKSKKELTAEDVNQWWYEEAEYSPPYKEGTPVYEITLTDETEFVRVYREDKSDKVRSWIMKEEQIEGLTAAQIKDKFALPSDPTHVCNVNVPANTKIRVGTAAEQLGFGGKGGSIQFDLMNKQNIIWFSDGIKLQ